MKKMKKDEKFIVYLSAHNPENDFGVTKKIQGFCAAAETMSFKTLIINQYCQTLKARRLLFKTIFKTNAKYIIIRSFGWCNIILLFNVIKARSDGRKVICDQPTPLCASIAEIKASNKSKFKKWINCLLTYMHGPFGFMTFNRIIQYARESQYFSFGVNHKMLKIGNGINIASISLRKKRYIYNEHLELVGVANVSNHHGYDRLIKAIAIFNRNNAKKARFTIIGGDKTNPVILNLQQLVSELSLTSYVKFCGFQDSKYINDVYAMSDLAIGSLGLYRSSLYESSILKVREYALAGIPFMAVGYDPDFQDELPFRFVVPNDDSIESIVHVLESFEEQRKTFSDEEIRNYALEHLSYESKIKTILSGL